MTSMQESEGSLTRLAQDMQRWRDFVAALSTKGVEAAAADDDHSTITYKCALYFTNKHHGNKISPCGQPLA